MDDREALLDSAPLPLVVLIEVGIVEGSAEEETVVEAEIFFLSLKLKENCCEIITHDRQKSNPFKKLK